MAEEFITPRIEVEPEAIVDEMNDGMATALPGWVPADASLENIIFGLVARQIAMNRELASEVLTLIFRAWGDTLGVTQIEASPASGLTTWTAIDNLGYTIPAGAQISIRADTGDEIGFAVVDEVLIPPAATVATGVVVQALIPGADGRDLNGVVTALDADLSWVDTIVLAAPTSGGVDEEEPDAYLNREVAELQLLSRQPILASDFAVIALRTAGVGRALALDLYNPADGTFDNELMVTLALVDIDGGSVPSPVKNTVQSELEALRGENFVINIIDPTYTTVDIVFTAVSYPGFDPATVQAEAIAALEAYLAPAAWGRPPFGDPGAVPGWVSEPVVRQSEISEQINRVDGIHYVTAITLGGRKSATADASNEIVTSNAHGLVLDDPVVFRTLTGGAGLTVGTTYYARDITTNTFKLAATPGGAAINITSNATAPTVLVSLQTDDVTLTGVAALTMAGDVEGTVTGS